MKIPKDGVLGWWTTDCRLQRGSDGFPYALTMKTHIYDFEKERKVTLEKYLQQNQDTICIYKYKEFQPGALPNVLVQEDQTKSFQFRSFARDNDAKNEVLTNTEACRALKHASLVWVMRHNKAKQRVEPRGLALLANKALFLPGDGRMLLPASR